MESVNPYDPPLADSQGIAALDLGSVGAVTSRFLLTPQHLIDTLARYRSQHSGRRLWRWLRFIIAFLFTLVAIAGLFVPQYFASAIMVAVAIFMFFPHKIDDYLAARSFRKSPHCNGEQVIRLADDGFRAESEIEQTSLKWSAFSNAVILDDGVLLYRGPKMVYWIPDATLESADGALRMRKLLAAKLPTAKGK